MKKQARLRSAANWVKTYNGKNIVQGYSKRYGVDLPCAIKELRAIGVEIKESYEIAVKRSIEQRALQKRKRKEELEKQNDCECSNSDETFAFIVGFTSGGAPYGVTWEEIEAEDAEKMDIVEMAERQEPPHENWTFCLNCGCQPPTRWVN